MINIGTRFWLSFIIGLILVTTVRSAESAKSPQLVLDMVHFNPGQKPFATQFSNPVFERNMGFNGKVFSLFESAHFVLNWDEYDTSFKYHEISSVL
jgi:hypothetical protein